MATYYTGMDVHCNNTELAVEKGRKIVEHHSVPTTIPAICEVLDSLLGKKHLAMEEGPMAGRLYRNLFDKIDPEQCPAGTFCFTATICMDGLEAEVSSR